ncbi:MAG: family N-acetyltransferase [Polyangiaceae bacterium]|jgi:ribosomal protein S18 acetylase RimI-like enzyme|nr:family N-acetyltransferase [Polyangiaceae bacterium]
MAEFLSRAFADDPFYDWLLPPAPRREAASRGFFQLLLRHLSDQLSETYTTSDLTGSALWLAPGKHQLSWWQQLRLIPSFTAAVGLGGIPRGLRIIAHMDALHTSVTTGPHYTLSLLGVEPSAQRRGLGHRLVQPILERCDQERLPAYVDTAKAHNVAFYERLGFELRLVSEHSEFPTFWCLTRAPR